MFRYILTLILFPWSISALAIDVGDVTSFIYPDQNSIAKEIKNTTDSARLISVKVVRLSSPRDDGKIIALEKPDELLLTPSRLILQGKTNDIVRFYYHGPADGQERYYRIYWTEQTLSEHNASAAKKSAIASTSARIGTILVVTPRRENFAWKWQGNKLSNNGNVSFRTIAYGPCLIPQAEEEECREKYNMLPNSQLSFKKIDIHNKKSRISIWHGEQFISVK